MSDASETAANRATIERFYTALSAGQYAELADFMSDDIVLNVVGSTPLSGWTEGKEACFGAGSVSAEVFSRLAPDFRMAVEWRIAAADGPTVVGVNRAEGGTANGGRYDQTYCQIFTLRDGKIVRIDEFFDAVVAESGLFGNELARPQARPASPFRVIP